MRWKFLLQKISQKSAKLNTALKTIDGNRTIYPVKLFESIVENEKLALSSLVNSDVWRSGEKAFADFVTVNIGQNGFNARVTDLSDSDSNLLFNYLKEII